MTLNEQFEQAIQYFYGEGVTRDLPQAVHLFTKAAEQGHAEAQYYLGQCYDNAYGISQDREKAAQWHLKAAKQGYAPSQFDMGCRYCNSGSGVQADAKLAAYWKTKAAEQGYTSELYNRDSEKERNRRAQARLKEYKEKLDKQNLKTAADLENLVKSIMKYAAKLTLKRKSEIPANTQTKSHFGGTPYFEKDETWPLTKNGQPLCFVFQIFNAPVMHLPANIKLIQFYYDFDERPWSTKDDGWLVKVYERLDMDNITVIENPDPDNTVGYNEIEYETIKTFPDDEESGQQNENVKMLSYMLSHERVAGYEKTVEKLGGQGDLHTQIGGYPHFLQGDGSPDDKDFILLFQLDSEEGFSWGDCGLVYAFYNPKTKETAFELQCC